MIVQSLAPASGLQGEAARVADMGERVSGEVRRLRLAIMRTVWHLEDRSVNLGRDGKMSPRQPG